MSYDGCGSVVMTRMPPKFIPNPNHDPMPSSTSNPIFFFVVYEPIQTSGYFFAHFSNWFSILEIPRLHCTTLVKFLDLHTILWIL